MSENADVIYPGGLRVTAAQHLENQINEVQPVEGKEADNEASAQAAAAPDVQEAHDAILAAQAALDAEADAIYDPDRAAALGYEAPAPESSDPLPPSKEIKQENDGVSPDVSGDPAEELPEPPEPDPKPKRAKGSSKK